MGPVDVELSGRQVSALWEPSVCSPSFSLPPAPSPPLLTRSPAAPPPSAPVATLAATGPW